jgi:membrane carboxypeptidase/penicillin-binding protein
MHCGVDPWAVARALLKTLSGAPLQGASTIQQQLVRVATGRRDITIRRKIREVVLAVAVGRYFSPDQLLALYLVKGYYGYRMSGLLQACERLRINAALASPVEAASLVARLKYPEPRHESPSQRARIDKRTRHILAKMARADRRGLTTGWSRPRDLLRIALGG